MSSPDGLSHIPVETTSVVGVDKESLKESLKSNPNLRRFIRGLAMGLHGNKFRSALLKTFSSTEASVALEVIQTGVETLLKDKKVNYSIYRPLVDISPIDQENLQHRLEPFAVWLRESLEVSSQGKIFVIDTSGLDTNDYAFLCAHFQVLNNWRNTIFQGMPGPLLTIIPDNQILDIEIAKRLCSDFMSCTSITALSDRV